MEIMKIKVSILGHLQRGGSPSAVDREVARIRYGCN